MRRRGIGCGEGCRDRMEGTCPTAGPGGNCVCPACGDKASHQQGKPCYKVSCPKCGAIGKSSISIFAL